MPTSGGKATKIACRAWVWSPDSQELAVVLNDLISIVPVEGGKTRRIADLKDLGLAEVYHLCWSPDGRNIACVADHIGKGQSRSIFVIPVEGGKATMLVSNDTSWKLWLSWSPDSKWISYDSEGPVKVRLEGTMWEADFEEILKKASR